MTAAAVQLEVAPVPGRPGYFSAALPDGRVLLRATRHPLFDCARALAAAGADPETVIAVRHRGNAVVAMRSTVGEAARWTIEESDRGGLRRRSWKPFVDARSSRDGVGENALEPVGVEERPGAHPRQRVELAKLAP